jgi:Endonuclease/Exonuclease/phosphatase family
MRYFIFLSQLMWITCLAQSQNGPNIRRATVALYNVENLWDTIPSADYINGRYPPQHPLFHQSIPLAEAEKMNFPEHKGPWSDEALNGKQAIRYQSLANDFTPFSPKNYNAKIYQQKLKNAARVISELGADQTQTAPVVVGLLEVENEQVVADLVRQKSLDKYNYGIVHYNSYDARGIDVALIYQQHRFVPQQQKKLELKLYNEEGKREYTRDILMVSGLLDQEKVCFFINHWPSRRGGEENSMPRRQAAAQWLKKHSDSLSQHEPLTQQIIMGDFNDNPDSPSLINFCGQSHTNLMQPLHEGGFGSLVYKDVSYLFDQILVSNGLFGNKISQNYSVDQAYIYKKSYLINHEGNYKNYPFRSWEGDNYTGGYSDHFGVYAILQRYESKR